MHTWLYVHTDIIHCHVLLFVIGITSIYTNYICNCVYKNFISCGFRFLLSTQFPIAFRFLWQLSMFPHSRNGWDQDNHLPLQTGQRFVVQNQQTWVIILDLDYPYQHLEIMAWLKGDSVFLYIILCLHTCSSEHALFSGLSGLSSFSSEDKSTSAIAVIL